MMMMNCVRARLSAHRRQEQTGGEWVPFRFLKLVSHRDICGLVLAHLVTNPDEVPDHVLGRVGPLSTFSAGKASATSWAFYRVTPEQAAMLERLPGNPPQEHVVVFADRSGAVLLFDVVSPVEAAAIMDAAVRGVLLMDVTALPAVDGERQNG